MNRDIQMVVFDIAGTTVKDNGEIAIAFQLAMAEYGYRIPVEKINPLMGYKKPEAIHIMLREYEHQPDRITGELVTGIHNRFLELMVTCYTDMDNITALPHAEEVFARLHRQHIRIGLDTGFSRQITDVIIRRLGWLQDGKVDHIVCSDEVPEGRPQPFMIRQLMQEAGITDAAKVVKVGDTEVDINEGRNAGCLYTIGITTGAFSREQLLPYNPSFIIDDLAELLNILAL